MTPPAVLPLRQQAQVVNEVLAQRLGELLPRVMRETGFDAWIIACHEDHYDPVFRTMMPWQAWAPILQILCFFDNGRELELCNISRTQMHGLMPGSPWDPAGPEDQWAVLRKLVEARQPRRIGINESDVIWAADGLTAALKRKLFSVLGDGLAARCTSAETLATRWLEERLPAELVLYEQATAIAHALIRHCFSRQVITPGCTTTEDLEWEYWEAATGLGLPVSFKPFFRLFRAGEAKRRFGDGDTVIRPGDMVHCDVGVSYLRLLTDHQELAYVLKPGERDAPAGLKNGMAESIRLQDIFTGSWELGLSGNEILARALKRAAEANLSNPKIYSHSLGHYLHEPGPLMGLPWQQTSIPGRGDVIMRANTVYTVELRTDVAVPEWNNELVPFMLEQDAVITADGARYLDGRQTEFHLI